MPPLRQKGLNMYLCHWCEKRYATCQARSKHSAKEHTRQHKTYKRLRSVPKFSCKHCGKPYGSKKASQNHASKCQMRGLFGAILTPKKRASSKRTGTSETSTLPGTHENSPNRYMDKARVALDSGATSMASFLLSLAESGK